MAFFGVTEEQIDAVRAIDGADRIELATLRGKDFQFVIAKGSFAPGDRCLYLPVDSLLPSSLAERLGVSGKLAGRDKNRVKTVKLRGQISQGIVADLALVPDTVRAQGPDALTAHLGVTKYEPQEILTQGAILVELPDGLSVYDIEGADRCVDIAGSLHDVDVLVTEKVEGSNFSVLCRADGTVTVQQRTKKVVPNDAVEHTFWAVARRSRAIEFAEHLVRRTPGFDVAVYGEVIGPGIQGNLYKLERHALRLFDIKRGGHWLAPDAFLEAVASFYEAPEDILAPVLHKGLLSDWLSGRTIKQASNGRSKLADVPREGVVIRPLVERILPDFGRLILKQRSPEYLAKSEA
ncbi:MAG: RNA ligase family protein [Polyangiaceae bacterium]